MTLLIAFILLYQFGYSWPWFIGVFIFWFGRCLVQGWERDKAAYWISDRVKLARDDIMRRRNADEEWP